MNEKYPDGKLNQGDEGTLKIATYTKDNRVIMDFGKDLSWIGFDKETLGKEAGRRELERLFGA